MKGFIGGIVFSGVVAIVLVLLIAYSGWANVAATAEPSSTVEWFLTTTRDNAIEDGAEQVREQGDVPDLDQARLLDRGLEHFNGMCVTCHGAPGVEPAEYAPDMEPSPPDLTREDRPPEAIFWIVKNGIQKTGMPAFGPTHSDEDLWALVAFIRRLPAMTAEDYAGLVRAAGLKLPEREEEHGEEHGHEGHEAAEGSGSGASEPAGAAARAQGGD